MEHNTIEEQLDYIQYPKPIPVEQFNDPVLNASPDDELPSFGHGTLEILEVTQLGLGDLRAHRKASALLGSADTYET